MEPSCLMQKDSAGHGIIFLEMKAERAAFHLKAFNNACDNFLKDNPHTFIGRKDPRKGSYIHRIEYKAFPWEIGTTLGEFIYSARTGLDQTAWQLALLKKKNPGREVYFPCVWKKNATLIESALKPFTKPVRDVLDTFQPYHAGDAFQDHPLWQLNKLSNLDKHQMIPINSTGVEVYLPDPPQTTTVDFEDAIEYHMPLSLKDEMQGQPIKGSEIILGEWGSDLKIPRAALKNIYDFITLEVGPKLSGFFTNAKDPRFPRSRSSVVRIGR
jgi:hypothetical protein